jgi:hypothetical protein
MCNAHNHPIGCTCGWGGEGHLGKRTPETYTQLIESLKNLQVDYFIQEKYSSYVNPNARCPVCGDPVYFYKSENGGRVFFDELGPPWTKHPCTDTSLSYDNIYKATFFETFNPRWKIDGWIPVTIKQTNNKNSTSFIISRLDKSFNNKIQIYSDNENFAQICESDCLHQLKRVDKSQILISSFSLFFDKEITFQFTVEPQALKDFINKN